MFIATRFTNKLAIIAVVATLVAIIPFGNSAVFADNEDFTTINAKDHYWFPSGAFRQEATLGGNVKVLMDSDSSGTNARLISHEKTFHETFTVRLVAVEPMNPKKIIPLKKWPYTGVSYENMKVDFITEDDVQATIVKVNHYEPPHSELKGKTEIHVKANTDIDKRQVPREERNYVIKVTLRNVKAVRPNGTEVALGNFIITFPDKVVFMHNPSKMPVSVPMGGMGGGGVVHDPEEIGASGPSIETGNGFTHEINTNEQYLAWLKLWFSDDDENNNNKAPTIVIPEGEDLFNVQPFEFQFGLPQNFFGPGSQPFEGNVVLEGANEGTDTTIRRLGHIELEGELPRTDVIPVEMVQLNLASVAPITVNFSDGATQLWDIVVSLPPELPPTPTGEMTITESHDGGGTFNAQLLVQPRFIFIPVGDSQEETRFIDEEVAPLPISVVIIEDIIFSVFDIPWQICPGTGSDFCPDDTLAMYVEFQEDAR